MLEHLLRELTPQVLGAVAKRHGDFAAAEDAVQDALIAAAEQWPRDGVPANPRGWLYHVAMRRLTDQMRSELARKRREERAVAQTVIDVAPVSAIDAVVPALFGAMHEDEDESLILLFMCCHPALTTSSAIALTLRAVGGLTTAEIASAFFVPEATMAQRISRAKQSIKSSEIPFQSPTSAERAERLGTVLHVLYLIFNEGYTSSQGDTVQRTDLSSEAIRLTRMLQAQLPDDHEVTGLLALMLLTDARRAARTRPDGALIPLDEQDRSLWNAAQIAEGVALVSNALAGGAVGPYQIQAAIAAVHDEASRAEETDWAQIAALYGLLMKMTDNPMVALNHAIAVAMVEGPQVGIDRIAEFADDPRIAGHYRIDAVRGHLYERLGKRERAVAYYRAAAEGTASAPERRHLLEKAARLSK